VANKMPPKIMESSKVGQYLNAKNNSTPAMPSLTHTLSPICLTVPSLTHSLSPGFVTYLTHNNFSNHIVFYLFQLLSGTNFVNLSAPNSHKSNNSSNVQWALSMSMYDHVCLWMLSLATCLCLCM
jgi:hypothetical protein